MINSIFIHVGPAPIDITAQNNLLLHASAGFSGGHVFFVGTVRGDEVCAITLEHYPGMTEKALTVIAKKSTKTLEFGDRRRHPSRGPAFTRRDDCFCRLLIPSSPRRFCRLPIYN